jgi:hypothetical protein
MAVFMTSGIFEYDPAYDDAYEAAKARILTAKLARLGNTGRASSVTSVMETDLDKVGPKGYIHGWIYVGGGEGDKLRATASKIDSYAKTSGYASTKKAANHLRSAATILDKGKLSEADYMDAQKHIRQAGSTQGGVKSAHVQEIKDHSDRLYSYWSAQHGAGSKKKPKT